MGIRDLTFYRLDPEKVIDLSYDQHVLQDPFASSHAKEAAQRSLDHIKSFHPEPATADGWYLAGVWDIITSHANSITKAKIECADKQKIAYGYETTGITDKNIALLLAAIFRQAWKMGSPLISGAIMFTLLKTLSFFDLVPTSLLNEKGHTETAAALLLSLIVGALCGLVVTWNAKRQEKRDKYEIESLRQAAKDDYEQSKQLALDADWIKLRKLWREYADEEWSADPPAIRRVMEGDREMNRQFGLLLKAISETELDRFKGLIRARLQARQLKIVAELGKPPA